MALHYKHSLGTVDTNTLDIDDVPTSSDCQPTALSAHSPSEACLAVLLNKPLPEVMSPRLKGNLRISRRTDFRRYRVILE